jgi:hypothetical protein
MKLLSIAFLAVVAASAFAHKPATDASYFIERETFRVTHQSLGADLETPLSLRREYQSSAGDKRLEYFEIRSDSTPPDFRVKSVSVFQRGGRDYHLDPDNHTARDLEQQFAKWLNEDLSWSSAAWPTDTKETLGETGIFGLTVQGTRTTTHYPSTAARPSRRLRQITESWRSQDPH